NRGLSDLDAELKQLAVYPRRAPKRICDAHLADQAANVHRYRRPTTERPRLPAPIGSKPSAMPTKQRRWANDFQGVQQHGRQPLEPDKQQPVEVAESHSLGGTAPQNVELMPENEDFGYHGSSRSEQPDQGVPDQPAKIAHRANYRPICRRQSL